MGKLTRIHVNKHIIRSNQVNGNRDPVLTVKDYQSNTKGNQVDILDDNGKIVASVVYRPDKPLNCGAQVWIETKQTVKIS
jgi:hypothetical protein